MIVILHYYQNTITKHKIIKKKNQIELNLHKKLTCTITSCSKVTCIGQSLSQDLSPKRYKYKIVHTYLIPSNLIFRLPKWSSSSTKSSTSSAPRQAGTKVGSPTKETCTLPSQSCSWWPPAAWRSPASAPSPSSGTLRTSSLISETILW